MKEAEKKLDEAARNLSVVKERVEKQKKERGKMESKCKKVNKVLVTNGYKRSDLLEKENEAEARVVATYKELEELKKQEEHRQERILKATEDLAAAEQDLKDLPVYEQPVAKLEVSGYRAASQH